MENIFAKIESKSHNEGLAKGRAEGRAEAFKLFAYFAKGNAPADAVSEFSIGIDEAENAYKEYEAAMAQ